MPVDRSGTASPAIFLMGPTASGKTELAVALAGRFPVELISVDSAMVYRGMDIGTAKPSAELRSCAPHRLVDIVEPEEAYSAARFRADALEAMRAITEAGRVPLLVGGTMLYFRALERGLSELPEADPEVRGRLAARGREEGWPTLHAELARVDPDAAARIHANDPQRIQRALEVWELTGRPMTELYARDSEAGFPYRSVKLAVVPSSRQALHDRIAARFRDMIEAGLVEEVRALRCRPGVRRELPAVRAVGYRQIWDFLDGRIDLETAIERGIAATRQLAKRQITWLRRETGVHWLPTEAHDLLARADAILRSSGIPRTAPPD